MNNQTHTPKLLHKIDSLVRGAGTWGSPAADHFLAADGGWRNATPEV